MIRREFLSYLSTSSIVSSFIPMGLMANPPSKKVSHQSGKKDREYWANLLFKITNPVFSNLANETLVKNMPVEKSLNYDSRENVSYLEAVGRSAAGIAPWLELPDDDSKESLLRNKLRINFIEGIKNGVNPSSPDYLNFRKEKQPIVDAAYLAQAFLRAPNGLWYPLDDITKKRVITEFKALRTRKPHNNNWLIFRAITEVFLLSVDEDWRKNEVDNAIASFDNWYVGDGWYGDGPKFSFNYYNSFAMHPMLLDTMKVLLNKGLLTQEVYALALKRMLRFVILLERMISPEGTFPLIGRSLTYRTGAFQALSMASLMHKLPDQLKPPQVRCALTTIKKNLFVKNVFDKNDWLQLGFRGHQPEIADYYTSTGSLYMTTLSFLPLGLPATDDFWIGPAMDWTTKLAWRGEAFEKDYHVQY